MYNFRNAVLEMLMIAEGKDNASEERIYVLVLDTGLCDASVNSVDIISRILERESNRIRRTALFRSQRLTEESV